MNDEQRLCVGDAFHLDSRDRFRKLEAGQHRLVHYTSCEAAESIIRNRRVWMRSASVMNDLHELKHGAACLVQALARPEGKRLLSVVNSVWSGLGDELERTMLWLINICLGPTYVACLSEHDAEEQSRGRLSMWRAYGGTSPVCVVLRNAPLVRNAPGLGVWAWPVDCRPAEGVAAYLGGVADRIDQARDLLCWMPENEALSEIRQAFRSVVLCTKHPGFSEEREWRVLHSPEYTVGLVETSTRCVDGVLQMVREVPLVGDHEAPGGVRGLPPAEFVDRIVVGPSRHQAAVGEALAEALCKAGAADAHERVVLSDIPLRC